MSRNTTAMMEFLKAAPLDSPAKYERALALFEKLWGSRAGSYNERLFHILGDMIEAYEAGHDNLGLPDPIRAIEIRVEVLGLSKADLEQYIGSRSTVYKVLNRRRPLTLPMVRALSAGLTIPMEVLTQPYEIEQYESERAYA